MTEGSVTAWLSHCVTTCCRIRHLNIKWEQVIQSQDKILLCWWKPRWTAMFTFWIILITSNGRWIFIFVATIKTKPNKVPLVSVNQSSETITVTLTFDPTQVSVLGPDWITAASCVCVSAVCSCWDTHTHGTFTQIPLIILNDLFSFRLCIYIVIYRYTHTQVSI